MYINRLYFFSLINYIIPTARTSQTFCGQTSDHFIMHQMKDINLKDFLISLFTKRVTDYTSGSIGGTMVRTAFMMLAATIAISGYNIVDTYFVGKLGKIPLAAMSLTFPLVMLCGCILRGFASGVMTLTAQATGAGNTRKAAGIVTSGLWLAIIVSAVLAAAGILSIDHLLRITMNSSEEAAPLAKEYMIIWYCGCVTATLGMCSNDILIAVGDSRRASAMMVFGLVINAILDPLFISGIRGLFDGMGVSGAALATVIAQFLCMFVILYFLHKRHHLIRFEWIPLKEFFCYWREIIFFAIPSSLGMLMIPIGALIMTRITNHFGDTIVAAVGVAMRIESIAFIFPMSLGMSLLPMVGQNFGAKKYSRIHSCRRFSMRFALCFLLLMAAIYTIFAKYLGIPFTQDEGVLKYVALSLMIMPWGYPFTEIHRYSTFFYTGCGHPIAAALLNAMRVGILLFFSFIAYREESITGFFMARPAADILSGLIGWWLVHRLTKRLPEDGASISK